MQASFPARLDNLPGMTEFIQDSWRALSLPESFLPKLDLACEEALVNIINYAYPDAEGDLEITMDSIPPRNGFGTGVEVRLCDSGVAFDPLQKKDPVINLPPEERPIGGLGIFLIRRTMDEVTYRRTDGRNILTMRKWF